MFPHTLFQREAIIAADEMEKYTDIRVNLAQLSLCLWLSGGTPAGTENRKDKVHTLQQRLQTKNQILQSKKVTNAGLKSSLRVIE